MLNSIFSLYPRPALRHHFFWSSTFSAAACLATVCIASPTCSVAEAAMRDIDLLFSLLTSARDGMPASWFRRDVDWFVQLRNKALAAKAQAQSQSRVLEVDNGPSPETDAELEIVGWRTKLVKRSERVEDDFSQSQQPWTITSNLEAQPAADGVMSGMSAEDWVRLGAVPFRAVSWLTRFPARAVPRRDGGARPATKTRRRCVWRHLRLQQLQPRFMAVAVAEVGCSMCNCHPVMHQLQAFAAA
jgi:hypothetical protein